MPAQYPGIGFPPSSQVSLLRTIANNTAIMAESPGGGGYVPVPPSAPSDPGTAGQWSVDEEYLYVYSSAAGQWLRTAVSDWS